MRTVIPHSAHRSHEATRIRERGTRRFKPADQAQGCRVVRSAVYTLFNPGRRLARADRFRELRRRE